MVQLETGLHAVVVVELDEAEAAALGRLVDLGGYADGNGGDLLEVLGEGLFVGGVGEVSYTNSY